MTVWRFERFWNLSREESRKKKSLLEVECKRKFLIREEIHWLQMFAGCRFFNGRTLLSLEWAGLYIGPLTGERGQKRLRYHET